jgi:MFS transporter, UMF1 family
LMAYMAPAEEAGEMFGLFALSGKATAFLGPFLVASLTAAFNSQRAGMSVVVIFFVIGGLLLLLGVPDKRASGGAS